MLYQEIDQVQIRYRTMEPICSSCRSFWTSKQSKKNDRAWLWTQESCEATEFALVPPGPRVTQESYREHQNLGGIGDVSRLLYSGGNRLLTASRPSTTSDCRTPTFLPPGFTSPSTSDRWIGNSVAHGTQCTRASSGSIGECSLEH